MSDLLSTDLGSQTAFPSVQTQFNQDANGLTKRELFAAMAMQGLLSNLSTLYRDGWRAQDIEEFACIRADALLAELSKVPLTALDVSK